MASSERIGSGTVRRALCAALLLAQACAWPLEAPDSGTGTPAVQAPPLESCSLWTGLPAFELGGTVRSALLSDGRRLWLVDGGHGPGQDSAPVLAIEPQPAADPCVAQLGFAKAFASEGVLAANFASALDLAVAGTQVFAFYEAWRFEAGQPFGVRILGRGLARYDADRALFVPSDHLLWQADRPGYGQSALILGGLVYAYGCLGTEDGWSRACYVARNQVATIDSASSWQYAAGSDQWKDSPDAALPILTHAGDLSVRPHASGHLLATYIAPLDTMVQVRSMLGPAGPFSAAHDLGRCVVQAGEFCAGAVRHPELEPAGDTLALSWARASFSPLPAGRSRPQWSLVAVPAALPLHPSSVR